MRQAPNAATRPAIALLPGLLCDKTVWVDQVAGLSPEWQCVVPEYGMRNSIADMAALVLETMPTGRFSVAGHSMGGRVALEVLRQAPERVERLALLDTGYQGLAPSPAGEKERDGRMVLLAQARSEGMRAMGLAWAKGMVHPDQLGGPVHEDILAMIERSTPEQFEAQITALLNRPDATTLLPTITCPTLLLCGRDDVWSPPARHEDMLALIPGSKLSIVDHSGHMSTVEQPAAVTQALREWLAIPTKQETSHD